MISVIVVEEVEVNGYVEVISELVVEDEVSLDVVLSHPYGWVHVYGVLEDSTEVVVLLLLESVVWDVVLLDSYPVVGNVPQVVVSVEVSVVVCVVEMPVVVSVVVFVVVPVVEVLDSGAVVGSVPEVSVVESVCGVVCGVTVELSSQP